MTLRLHRVWRLLAPPKRAGVLDISLDVPEGEFLTLVGPSGSGKTTLLRLIAGLENPDRGRITIDGRDVTHWPPHERDVALVPQRPALYPQLSIRENLAIGANMRPRRQRPAQTEVQRRVEEAVSILGLGGILDRRPEHLSGGEQQRVMLGRLLVRRPRLWLLDEPFSHLDLPNRLKIRRETLLLRERFPATIIAVTHDPVEAVTLGDRLAVLMRGRLRQVGEPAEVLAKPASSAVAAFLGWPVMNLTTGVLIRAEPPGPALQFAAADGAFRLPMPAELVTHGAEGQPVTVGIRPEALVPHSASTQAERDRLALPGWEVQRVELLPPHPLVVARCGNWEWWLWWRIAAPPILGEKLTLYVAVGDVHWFAGKRGRRWG